MPSLHSLLAPHAGRLVSFSAVLLLGQVICAQTTPEPRLIKDIEYGTAPTPVPVATPPGVTPASATVPATQKMESLRLDACIPPGEGPFPVVIIVHGGGWGSGDKTKDITPVFEPLTKAGFVWFSINYRLAPANRWPACLEDVQTAIRWTKAHAAEYQGDPRRIAVLGHSAGGQLAFLAALQAKDEFRVQAVVGLAPVTDMEQDLPVRQGLSVALQNLLDRPKDLTPESLQILRDLSPINHLPPAPAPMPAFLVIQGDADKTVPLQQSLNFQARAKDRGGVCDLVTVMGAPHAVLQWDKFDMAYKTRLTDWLTVHLKNTEKK
jgi:alpha-L-fucosidase 2